jgi:transmembrane sensor
MNMASKIDIEAAGWVARLQSSDATKQDRLDFERWLAGDPARKQAYESFQHLWGELRHIPVTEKQLKLLRRKRKLSSSGGVTALLLLAAVGVAANELGYVDRWKSDYYTVAGEVRTVQLEDGSRINLNTDSAVIIRYSAHERRVELLRGEAFFDVAKNEAQPFIVTSGSLSAQALGTHYAVRTATRNFPEQVQVEEGRVEVRSNNKQAVLEAGETAVLNSAGDLHLTKQDVTMQTAWREGKLIFSERRLQEVLNTLARYRNGRILIMDEALANQKVSGIFDINDTDAALNVLAQTLNVRVTRLTNMLVFISSK